MAQISGLRISRSFVFKVISGKGKVPLGLLRRDVLLLIFSSCSLVLWDILFLLSKGNLACALPKFSTFPVFSFFMRETLSPNRILSSLVFHCPSSLRISHFPRKKKCLFFFF